MPRVRSGNLTVVAIAFAAMGVVAATGALVAPGQGQAGGRGSSFSSAPDGAKAAFLALKELGYRVERSYEPLASLNTPAAQSTIVMATPVAAISAQDRRWLQRFVNDGGIVLATGSGGASALGADVQRLEELYPLREARTCTVEVPSPLAANAAKITMAAEASATFDDRYVSVFGADYESAVRTARIGTGTAIWWAGSTPLTNAAVAELDNFTLLVNALGGRERAVVWDEHYHGHSRSLWSYVKGTPLPWVAAQAGLIALAAALTFTRRREPVRPPVVDARTSPMEFVETVGGLYARAGAASAAIAASRERLRRLLVASCGLAITTPDDRLARAAAARLDMDARALAELLARAARAARNPRLRTDDALPIAQELQAAAAAVVAARSRHRARPSQAAESIDVHCAS